MNKVKSFFFFMAIGYGSWSLDFKRDTTIIFNYKVGHYKDIE